MALPIREESLAELQSLLEGLGWRVPSRIVQLRRHMRPGMVFGSGKLEQAREAIARDGVRLAAFDGNLSPAQSRNLERELNVMVADRTQVILDIFAQNARTREARKQVELARLEYMLPRLVGLWAHLDRERGGINSSRGMGEKQIDIDRTMIRKRIAHLREALERLGVERRIQAKRRRSCFRVSLVGYTNAGKSTLMGRLSKANPLIASRPFATLDSTTRLLCGVHHPPVLLSDTVGFIRNLPHPLVASFRSTLDVVREAELLVHVVDLSHENFAEHLHTAEEILSQVHAQKIPQLLVFNKIDRVTERTRLLLARKAYPGALFISAQQQDCTLVREGIVQALCQVLQRAALLVPYPRGDLLRTIYRWCHVESVQHDSLGMRLRVCAAPQTLKRIYAQLPSVEEESAPT